ncbi:hypothetical protein BN938_0717 [Mucinivorans hirudinis]|uniref:Uncharacterized protein n=1 Tax=Mucinivorans hirudinis TaxID=1433126 RepID=A0A060R6X0_9BACT|nr:hypothetical protein BN938_0717 [Mucinivorans hirudinis]
METLITQKPNFSAKTLRQRKNLNCTISIRWKSTNKIKVCSKVVITDAYVLDVYVDAPAKLLQRINIPTHIP